MMKTFSIFLMSLLAVSCQASEPRKTMTDFDPTYNEAHDGQIIAIVGEKIAFDYIPHEAWCVDDMGVGDNLICMDNRYHARYKVLERLKGEYNSDVIDFIVYDHAARDPFYNHDRVILYIRQHGETFVHVKYQYDRLSPLKSGGYAVCGDPFSSFENHELDDADIERIALKKYDFDPPIEVQIPDFLDYFDDQYDPESQEDVRESFLTTMKKFAPPAYEIRGRKAICRMGLSAQETSDVWFEIENAEWD